MSSSEKAGLNECTPLSGINNVTLKEEKIIVRLTTGAKGKYFLQVLNCLFVSSYGFYLKLMSLIQLVAINEVILTNYR